VACKLRVRQVLWIEEAFLPGIKVIRQATAISGDVQGGVRVEAMPPASFKVRKAKRLLEFLVAAHDTPLLLGGDDQGFKGCTVPWWIASTWPVRLPFAAIVPCRWCAYERRGPHRYAPPESGTPRGL
jgi:hypothetical protein